MTRLVTFLGIPQKPKDTATTVHEGYQLTTYRRYDANGVPTEQDSKTPWIAIALAEFFRPSEAHVLATEEAWNDRPPGANRGNGEALAHELGRRGVAVERVPIPTGLSAAELWQQFEALKSSLRGPKEGQIVLDITHGLRNQPFFAGAVVAFVAMIDEERPDLRVVYGAHDLIRTLRLDHAPIVDLTPFVELLDWTHDLVLFLKSGRLGRLRERTEAIGRALRRAWFCSGRASPEPRVREFAVAIEQFARDLQTIRTGSLLLGTDSERSSVRRLLDETAGVRDQLAGAVPPLADVLDRVEDMARQLEFEGAALTGARARDVLARLAWLYFRMGRYIEAATTVRESFVSLQGPAAAAMPGRKGYDHNSRLATDEGMRKRLGDRFRELADLRNDLDHAGYNPSPKPPKTIVDMTRRWIDELSRAACVPGIFANISNHPSEEWEEEQRVAARHFADTLLDVPFPEVPPEADAETLLRLADDIVAALPPETTHAMVQGEFTLTVAIVRRLQQKGIRCLAATTERRVERTADEREVRSFRFVRFREYPRLA